MVRQAAALLVVVASLGGCGGDDAAVDDESPTPSVALADCTLLEPGVNDRFQLCRSPAALDRGGFAFRGRGPIPIAYPYESQSGHWSGGSLSPDGRTLLAQWTAECEVAFAFFVAARGGTPRLVTGERRVEDAPPSIAHGWTRDGEAIIEIIGGCSESKPAGRVEIWLISPGGGKRRLGDSSDG